MSFLELSCGGLQNTLLTATPQNTYTHDLILNIIVLRFRGDAKQGVYGAFLGPGTPV